MGWFLCSVVSSPLPCSNERPDDFTTTVPPNERSRGRNRSVGVKVHPLFLIFFLHFNLLYSNDSNKREVQHPPLAFTPFQRGRFNTSPARVYPISKGGGSTPPLLTFIPFRRGEVQHLPCSHLSCFEGGREVQHLPLLH